MSSDMLNISLAGCVWAYRREASAMRRTGDCWSDRNPNTSSSWSVVEAMAAIVCSVCSRSVLA